RSFAKGASGDQGSSKLVWQDDRLALSNMFSHYNTRKKDGKEHRYWSVVECGGTLQRLGKSTVCGTDSHRKSLGFLLRLNQTMNAAAKLSDLIDALEFEPA